MKYRIFLLTALILVCGMVIFGCTGQSAGEDIYIAVITKSTDSDFWQSVERGVNAAAVEYNIKVTFDGPESEEDFITQNAMITSAVARGADAIVLSAIDYNLTRDAVDAAAAAGVRVITIDSGVDSERVSAFIGTDNSDAGRLAGEVAVKAVSERAVVGIVNSGKDTANVSEREKRFRECVESSGGVVAASEVVESKTESARDGALKMLEEHPEINVIVGFNEWTTLGVGEAVRELDAAERVVAIGFDSNIVSIGMLETGVMDALIVQNPFAIGYLGVRTAVSLLSGKDVPESEFTDITVVTKENMFDTDIQRILFRFR